MTTLALHGGVDQAEVKRWSASATLVVAVHAALIACYLFWYTTTPPPGRPLDAIAVDLAPMSAAPQPKDLDLAPGPTMQAAEPPAPEPEQQQKVEETIAPTPLQQNPEVVAPPEPKKQVEEVREKPKPVVVKKKPKKPSTAPAPRTTAAPRAEHNAPMQQSRSGAAAAAALPSYRQRLAAHLQRYKQYPSEARASGARGTVLAVFTVHRSGSVSGVRVMRSSGNAALDNAALSAIRNAQPLPAIPSEIPQSALTFPVPFSFSVR
jgi:protein TonB